MEMNENDKLIEQLQTEVEKLNKELNKREAYYETHNNKGD